MAIKHKHHIVPRHMGGTDDKSNIIELTVQEHAIAHKKLWKQFHKIEDKIAWLCLSGQIDNAEAIRLAGIAANTGKIVSEETRKKMSLSRRGQKRNAKTKQNISNSLKNKPKSKKHVLNMSGPRPHVNQRGANNNNAKTIKTPYGIFGSIQECVVHIKQKTNNKEDRIRYNIFKNLKNDTQNWSLL